MKNLISFLPAVLLLIFTGCIEIKTLIIVNSDGSGTIEETIYMSREVLEMMQGFSSAFTDSTEQQEFDIFDEKNLKEHASDFGNGVVYLSGEKLKKENKEGFRALYSFTSLNEISLSKIPQNQMPLNLTESQGSDYLFTFIKGSPSEILISIPDMKDSLALQDEEEEIDSQEDFASADSLNEDSAFTQKALQLMKDAHISLAIRTGNSIVETNAAFVEGPVITLFEVDFSKLLENKENFQQLMKFQPKDFDQVKELLKDIPGIRVETSKEVSVKFN